MNRVVAVKVLSTVLDQAPGTESPKTSDGDSFPPTETKLSGPTSLAIDPQDRLYIADSGNHRIRTVDAAGIVHAWG